MISRIASSITNSSIGNYEIISSILSVILCILFIKSVEEEIAKRDTIINGYNEEKKVFQNANSIIGNSLLMSNNFTEQQLIRLNSFLREDELHLDDIVQTSLDNLSSSFKIKQDAMESGRIELKKLSQPQLQFSMEMANIYALHEFDPIVNQFQLGNIIRVGIRNDYIKQSRLLQVDINFEDFSDFSVEFGELTSLRTQSDIHADLLSKAISAGKSVATNSSYWTKGSDAATSTDLKIQQGLLDATTQIKAIDGSQGIVIDKNGIRLQKIINQDTGEIDPRQVWMVNNMILMSDDGFKTSRSALGEVTVDGETYYGLIAEIVLSGYIEGSRMVGGTIQIGETYPGSGEYAFEVHEDGTVTMGGGSNLGGQKVEDVLKDIEDTKNQIKNINISNTYSVRIESSGPLIMRNENQSSTLTCKVYSSNDDITKDLEASLFNWKRVSNDSDSDIEWNNKHKSMKKITITTEDVVDNATFNCEVDIPD